MRKVSARLARARHTVNNFLSYWCVPFKSSLSLGEEKPFPHEHKFVRGLIEETEISLKKKYANAHQMLRGVHPKAHGVVGGKVEVIKGLPDELRVGLFANEDSYPAWIRFSIARSAVTDDRKRSMQGAAIKLVGVPGQKLLDNEKETHDLIFVSHPTFPFANIKDVLDVMKANRKGTKRAKVEFLLKSPQRKIRFVYTILTAPRFFSSPLDIKYWSTQPYAFGEGRAVKYALWPSSGRKATVPGNKTQRYLRHAMKRQLAKCDYEFDLLVQLQTDPFRMPIEVADKRWNENTSPFRKVATVSIPRQDFDFSSRDEEGEHLSFNPWRALPAHRPLGNVSRARKAVYETSSRLRHSSNSRPERNPGAPVIVPPRRS